VSRELQQLADRIRTDLAELEQVLRRVDEVWHRAKHSIDDYYIDSVALNLHGFYNGLERIFERVAAIVDGSKPKGENWRRSN
jgi:hypothetical protein